ncbi:MAG: type I phosphomannose isomerase catalytic subunit, partial [Candidatus Brocadiales bacterium]
MARTAHSLLRTAHRRQVLETDENRTMDVGLYPLRFKGIFKETPWGGNRLREVFGKDTPRGKRVGESWEIVDRGDVRPGRTPAEGDNSLIVNGPYRGVTLHELMEQRPVELLGSSGNGHVRFPLLVKFLDVTDRLSVQVHPDDAYAKAREKDGGKTEAWYVISTEPGAWIVHGLKEGIPLEFFAECLKKGDRGQIESCLNFLSVKSGDTIFIPPGTLHAAGDGLLLLEVQQNSDLTYRVYDWGSDRPLQPEKALGVMKEVGGSSTSPGSQKSRSRRTLFDRGGPHRLLECEKFIMELLELEEAYERKASGFHILTF